MKCHICSEECREFTVKRKRWSRRYHSCPRCEYIFMDEADLLSDKEELLRYEDHNNSIEDEGYREYFKRFIEYSMEKTDRGAQILDYGSGPEPVLASVMEEAGFTHVDIYDKYFTDRPLDPGKKYDVITSTEVVEHIYKPMEVFRELAERLKPGGKLIVMTAFHPRNEEEFGRWWYINDPTHIVFYTLKTMEYIGKKAGLAIEKNNNKNIVVFRKEADEEVY